MAQISENSPLRPKKKKNKIKKESSLKVKHAYTTPN
jgi:hypothetical protein